MLRELFKLIGDFFRSLFGKKNPGPSPNPQPNPTPSPNPTPPPTPNPDPLPLDELSDASDLIELDTITISNTDTLEVIDGPVEPEIPPVEEPDPQPEPVVQRFMWCLDNGHGKLTAGKRSPVFDDEETQLLEYEFNRDIVERITDQLAEKGVAYTDLMPDVETQGNALDVRVQRANGVATDLPRLFISIHSNAGPADDSGWTSDSVSGIETWYYFGSVKGKKMASIFQKNLVDEMGWKDRGLKTSQSRPFYVLKKTVMPAILTENGFFNNKAQALELVKDDIRQRIADAHVAAILQIEKEGLS